MQENDGPDFVVVDIEGTVTPLDYVRVELMGWVRVHLPAWVEGHKQHTAVAKCAAAWGEGREAEEALRLMDVDSKDGLLKGLQAAVMEEGWASGELTAPLFDDVLPALRLWASQDVGLAVYSSGARAAQLAFFGHVRGAGDVRPLFRDFFDTAVGAKQSAESYRAIAAALEAKRPLFCTDVAGEAAAAIAGGWQAALLSRPGNAPLSEMPPAAVFDNLLAVQKHFHRH